MEKQIYVVFTEYPFGTNRMSEKLRMSVGFTLNDDNGVNLVFLGKARHALTGLDEKEARMNQITKHLNMLAELKASFFVEEGGGFNLMPGINHKLIKGSEVDGLLDSADTVVH